MKRFFNLFLVGLVAVLPFGVKALKIQSPVSCTAVDDNGNKTCTLSADFEGDTVDELTVTLEEEGGADILSVTEASATSDWTVSSKTNTDESIWTVTLTGPGTSGESSLLKFTYKVSGETDCKVVVSVNGQKTNTPTSNTTTENKQTGSTVPFVALGSLALLAGGAYVLTKNKSKMYNI